MPWRPWVPNEICKQGPRNALYLGTVARGSNEAAAGQGARCLGAPRIPIRSGTRGLWWARWFHARESHPQGHARLKLAPCIGARGIRSNLARKAKRGRRVALAPLSAGGNGQAGQGAPRLGAFGPRTKMQGRVKLAPCPGAHGAHHTKRKSAPGIVCLHALGSPERGTRTSNWSLALAPVGSDQKSHARSQERSLPWRRWAPIQQGRCRSRGALPWRPRVPIRSGTQGARGARCFGASGYLEAPAKQRAAPN